MNPRHTEEVAAETLLDLTQHLQALCFGHPTTAEIEEALRLVRPIEVTLRAWMSSRKLNQSHAKGAAQFREAHPAVAEVVEADRIEQAHPQTFSPSMDALDLALGMVRPA